MFVKLGYTISRKILRRLIRMVDTDHSGSLSFDEFLALVTLVSRALEREENNIPDETYTVDLSQFTQEELQELLAIFNAVGPSRLRLLCLSHFSPQTQMAMGLSQ
jgi:Ca2+-binding EF-hand superfamily protein